MMAQKKVLGKGLGALLSDSNDTSQSMEIRTVTEGNPSSIADIPISQIEPNPFQPRMTFDEDALNELADSIMSLGLIQPLTLRQIDKDKYQIISGERRFRAAKLAHLEYVPAYIRKADDTGMLEMAIVENIQRENLDAIETAISFQRLIDECDLTQENMAIRVGKKRATITNYLRLLKLPAEVQKAVKIGKISVGHAKALLSLEDTDMQLALCEAVIKNDMSVRQLEDKVRKICENSSRESSDDNVKLPDHYYKVAEIVGKYFDNNISLKRSSKGHGTMTVRFRDDSQLECFLKAIEAKQL